MAKNRLRISFPASNGEKWKKVVEQAKKIGPDKSIKILSGEKVEDETPEDKLEKDFAFRALRSKLKDKEQIYSALVKKYDKLKSDFDDYSAINKGSNLDQSLENTFKVNIKNNDKDTLIPIVIASDWHVEETVKKESVNGLNEFNLDIAGKRVYRFTNNLLTEINKYRLHSNVDEIIIAILGDMIGGYIHEELRETNSLSPIEAIIYVKDLIILSLDTILKEGDFNKIVILTSKGNHSRTGISMKFANESGTNYETFLYDSLRSHYANNKKIEFHIPEAGIGYYTIINSDTNKKYCIRYFHGWQCKGGGGIGGISTSINKFIMKLDSTQMADMNLLGHFHQLVFGKNFTINGSLKGYDAYALQNGFGYEVPQQGLMIFDVKKNMITNRSSILCE